MDQSEERGRPVVHTEPWANIWIVLLDRHVAYLDRLAIDIRMRGTEISRAEIIRGLIEWASANPADAAALEKFVSQFAGSIGESE